MHEVNSFSKEEFEEALRAISSAISKIEKVQGKETLGGSQKTLIERRLKALRIASELIVAKIQELEIT